MPAWLAEQTEGPTVASELCDTRSVISVTPSSEKALSGVEGHEADTNDGDVSEAAQDDEGDDAASARALSEGNAWTINVVPPPPEDDDRFPAASEPHHLDGDWVIYRAPEHLEPWLRSLKITGRVAVDGSGNSCPIIQGSTGPTLCGGSLRRHGDYLTRRGKSSKVQMYTLRR